MFWFLIVTGGEKRTLNLYLIGTSVISARSVLCFTVMLMLSAHYNYLYFIVTLVISTRSVLYLNVTLVISAYYFCTSLLR